MLSFRLRCPQKTVHPVINVRNQLVGSPLGKDVTIECSVEASPKSINYWIREHGEMIVSSSKFAVQEVALSQYETHMSVTVRSFAKEDIGSYRCIAKNSQGETDSSIRVYGEFVNTYTALSCRIL